MWIENDVLLFIPLGRIELHFDSELSLTNEITERYSMKSCGAQPSVNTCFQMFFLVRDLKNKNVFLNFYFILR